MPDLHPIVREELDQLADVEERLARPAVERAREEDLRAELERLKTEARHAKTEDKAALEQQYEHTGRLLEQIQRGRPQAEVDPASPYFAHLRVDQGGRRS